MGQWKPMVEELVRERSPRLLGYGTMLVGSVADAEDLVHDAIVKTFRRGRSFPHVNAAEQYVRRTMLTLAIDRHRSRGARDRALDRAPNATTASPDLDDLDAALDIEAAFTILSPRERACVLMRFYDDMTISAIGVHLGLADGTVKRYLSNAFTKFATVAHLDPAWTEAPEKISVTEKE
ncbi:MAG: sigma-70 family RNA polymerase sigma factor [Demequinaceae bacterium]|nr:sigma-70 family RNA polymerase sigma factor [Demequinaceae bacterium]